jgi:hypothetical protein
MTNTIPTLNSHDEAIRRLASGFGSDFAEFCASHERMHEVMMELANEFIDTNIPIVNEDDATDLGLEMIMHITVREV